MKDRRPKWTRSLFGSLQFTVENFKCDGVRLLKQVATDLYESLDTPVSLSCEILLRYGQLSDLCQKTVRASDYLDPFHFRDDYQAVSFLKKVPFTGEGFKPKDAALSKFLASEQQCKETNRRFRNFLSSPFEAPRAVRHILYESQRKIRELLGSVNCLEWLHACRFGPGVFNHPVSNGLTSVYDKLQVSPSVTHDFVEPATILVKSSPWWAKSITDCDIDGFWPLVKQSDFTLVPGNRVTFVPKTAMTHRAIAIEPLMNIFAQLGLGKLLRRRLLRCGIDLDDQLPNQEMARQGSIHGHLCTIDLSSASDTVARELVRFLLPEDWYSYLDMCRSKSGTIDGKRIDYEKFSSMGNGFTFELESLVFWALSSSACDFTDIPQHNRKEVLRVYGDDIIVPVQSFEVLSQTLEFCGFSLNRDKTFSTGLFRESCGKDYYDGTDVRPLFVKEVPERVYSLFILANSLRRLAARRYHNLCCDSRLLRAWKSVLSELPRSVVTHFRVPAHAGDSEGVISNWDEAQCSSFVLPVKGGWEGFKALRLQPFPVKDREVTNFNGAVATLLYRMRDGFGNDFVPAFPRQGRKFHYRLRDGSFYGPWTDPGGWV